MAHKYSNYFRALKKCKFFQQIYMYSHSYDVFSAKKGARDENGGLGRRLVEQRLHQLLKVTQEDSQAATQLLQ